jgi:hypothetical protein
MGFRFLPKPFPEVRLPFPSLPLLLPFPFPKKISQSWSDKAARKAPDPFPLPLPLLWPFVTALRLINRLAARTGLPDHCRQACLAVLYAQNNF